VKSPKLRVPTTQQRRFKMERFNRLAHTIGLLKGKSALEVMSFGIKSSRMVRGRTFWARGYCVSTVGLDEETIREYIRNQEQADKRQEEFGF
jgi:putative transposase